jgi:transcription initiation factor TFIIIB Brf1 subunit/transcription initiation factor TFIIB
MTALLIAGVLITATVFLISFINEDKDESYDNLTQKTIIELSVHASETPATKKQEIQYMFSDLYLDTHDPEAAENIIRDAIREVWPNTTNKQITELINS